LSVSGDSDNQCGENLPEELRVIKVDEDSNDTSVVEARSVTEVNQRYYQSFQISTAMA